MFFIPMGIWVGNPDITVGLYIWKGIIPALIGNILGGALFCGAYYWYMYLYEQEAPLIDGVPYGEHSDVEKGNMASQHLEDVRGLHKYGNGSSLENEVREVRETGA